MCLHQHQYFKHISGVEVDRYTTETTTDHLQKDIARNEWDDRTPEITDGSKDLCQATE